MADLTKKGLLILINGIGIQILATLCLFFVAGDLSGLFALALVVIISIVGGLLALVGFILLIIGRKEFGEKHSKLAIGAVIIYCASIVVSILFSMINALLRFYSQNSTDMSISSFQTAISAVFGGLMYVFLLYELEDKKGKIVLFAAFIATIVTSLFIALQRISLYEQYYASGTFKNMSFTEIFSSLSGLFKAGIYSVIGSAFLLLALFIAYKRITSGQLTAVVSSSGIFDDFRKTDSGRRCPNCGRMIPFDAHVCPYCARKF